MSDDDSDRTTVPVGLDEELYQDWLHAKKHLDEARDSFEQLDTQVRDRVATASDGCDSRVLVGGEIVGRYTHVVTYRFDSHAFKRQFPDIHEQFTRKSSYWRMSWARGDR